MAKILSDRQVKSLFGSVILGADEKCINPNGVEFRLGGKIKFLSTGEGTKDIPEGNFVKVGPGEAVIITSQESIDFRKETFQKLFPKCMLTAIVTPTTTIMREGITPSATKVDAGFQGNLNWGFRNSSSRDFLMQRGESLFKLTFFLLEGDEVPDVNYGDKATHKYQGTEGIMTSARRLPVDIPNDKVVSSSFEKLDPTKQLREAGHPFNYIGSELLKLQGNFELVSTGVATLGAKIDESKRAIHDDMNSIFERKLTRIASLALGAVSVLYGGLLFLQKYSLSTTTIALLAIVVGVAIPSIVWFASRNGGGRR